VNTEFDASHFKTANLSQMLEPVGNAAKKGKSATG
jgi:hypothetical protein